MLDGKIEIEGLFESRDYWRISLAYYCNYGTIFISSCGFVLYGLFITVLFLKGNFLIWHVADVVLTSGLFAIIFGFLLSYSSVKAAKGLKEGKYKFIFSNEELEMVGQLFTSHLSWKWFVKIRETKNYFIFVAINDQKTLLPKRFFRDYEQLSEFKNLIRSKLGEKAYLKKSKERLGLK